MKFRESGMPDENLWNTFFNPVQILKLMEINKKVNILIDIGCGYGTFLFPESRIVKKAIGIDIDNQMIEYCKTQIEEQGYKNIELILGDISQEKTLEILKSESVLSIGNMKRRPEGLQWKYDQNRRKLLNGQKVLVLK